MHAVQEVVATLRDRLGAFPVPLDTAAEALGVRLSLDVDVHEYSAQEEGYSGEIGCTATMSVGQRESHIAERLAQHALATLGGDPSNGHDVQYIARVVFGIPLWQRARPCIRLRPRLQIAYFDSFDVRTRNADNNDAAEDERFVVVCHLSPSVGKSRLVAAYIANWRR